MRKKITVTIVSILLIGCTQTPQTTTEQDTPEADDITTNVSQDECLSNPDALEQSQCYFELAMNSKDQNICESMLFGSSEELEEYFELNQIENKKYYDYLFTGRCKNEIEYSYQDAKWALEAGTPPWAEKLLIYTGKAELSGWIIHKPAYVGEAEAHFHVSDDDVQKLPPSLHHRQDYLLMSDINEWTRVGEDIIKNLEAISEAEMATIIVDKAAIAIEGSPALNFVNIVD